MRYKNLVFTKHALERLNDRTITAEAVQRVIQAPDKKFDNGGSTKFIRTLDDRKYHVVASYLKQEHTWLIISVWVRGEDDQQPLIWQLITLPFRFGWWLVKKLF
ncbi:MAG TPA: DUF4258 domain-containing protein [Patescibacteria group bacterium]